MSAGGRARFELEPSFVLHSRAYRETSAILEVFSRSQGRIGIVAKGVRRPGARWRGLARPFNPLLVSWIGGRELGTLTGMESTSRNSVPEGRALASGLYLNELLCRLLHRDDPHPDLFDYYAAAIGDLGQGRAVEPVLRVFEKRMLDALGYGMILVQEADGGAEVRGDRRYRYEPERGPVRADGDDSGGLIVSGATLRALDSERLEEATAIAESKRLMRAVLARYLGERPLASRALFRTGEAQSPRRS